MPDVTFLGTAAAVPTADRGYTSLVIFDGRTGMLIDCGAIVFQGLLRANIQPETITDLFITHAHIDHIGGLPSLLECLRLSGRRAPLRVWALPETLEVVDHLLQTFAFEIPLPLPYALNIQRLEGDGACPPFGDNAFSFIPVQHSIPTAGLRLSFPRDDGSAWTVVYSSDTRPIKALETFAQGCDLLILECTYLDSKSTSAERVGHMTAGQAGQLAHNAHAGALALVHLGLYDGWNVEQARSEAARVFAGDIIFPADGDRLHF
ncbi:MAG TPA: MBL fold metallo-hydrolase [Ktedonobacterales bacterium]|jgi:ribonuclease Z